MSLDRKALEYIAEGIKHNNSLATLDLTYCGIPDIYAIEVANVIKKQGELRDLQRWQMTLRQSDTHT
jgi:hypothetical protein